MTRRLSTFIVALAEVCMAAVVLYAPTSMPWLRVIVGIPFLLVLPGLALVLYVDPEVRLGTYEWFALCVSSSVALVALTSIALAATVGLTGPPLVGALTAVVLFTLALSAFGRDRAGSPHHLPRRRDPLRRAIVTAAGLLALATLILALTDPRLGVVRSANVVQLWGLPEAGGGMRIGVANVDAPAQDFTLTIRQHGQAIATQRIELPGGDSRVFELRSTAIPATDAPVVAELGAPDSAVGTRTISVWTRP